jgi:hypothetical protein
VFIADNANRGFVGPPGQPAVMTEIEMLCADCNRVLPFVAPLCGAAVTCGWDRVLLAA